MTEISNAELELQIERVLRSETLRTSEALRRLLRFLADRVLSGEADHLKEYSVAIDGLGKPPSYDARHDSTVRIQMGRLRRKLAEYYQTEGKDDPLIIELPKGRFKLTFEEHQPSLKAVTAVPNGWSSSFSRPVVLLCIALAMTVAWGTYSTVSYWRVEKNTDIFRDMWSADLNLLWQPFLDGRRPLVLSIVNPPFAEIKGFGVFRDRSLMTWDDFLKSPSVAAIRKSLNNPEVEFSSYYTPGGEVNASFLVGKLLGARIPTLSLLRTQKLSWQQLADNNVLYVGAAMFFAEQLKGMPVELELLNVGRVIQNLRPREGEPAVFTDKVTSPDLSDGGDGEGYALITHVPGPLETTEVESFTGGRTAVRMAAVQSFTDKAFARILVSKMVKPSGEIPRYYQVVLRVKFKEGVPTETTYIMHRELHATGRFSAPGSQVTATSQP
jgi:hypothetical protein